MDYIVNRFSRGDEAFFNAKGFSSQESFLEQYRKMSLLVVRTRFTPVWGRKPSNYTRNRIFINPDAQFAVPYNVADILSNADFNT
jgi:hypothetical protein